MNKLYFAFLILFSVVSFAQTKEEIKEATKKRDRYLFAAKPVQKKFNETVAYEEDHELALIPVTIDGKTYTFLFDTGATTVVSTELRDRLGLKVLFSNKLVDGSGTVNDEKIYGMDALQLGSVTFTNVAVAAMDFSKFEEMFCVKLDGIFGTNLMRTAHWKIDYNNKSITFSDKRIKPEGKTTAIDFIEGFSGSPMIKHYFGEYNYYSMMDTGYNGNFSFPDSLFFKSRKSKELNYKRSMGRSSVTLYESKPNAEYTVMIDSIQMDSYFMKNQIARVSPGDIALTGNATFAKFGTIILDWKSHKIYVPDMTIKDDTDLPTYGFNPWFSNNTLHVGLVWDDSPAGKQGMEVGDVITSINGTDTKTLSQETWCKLLEFFTNREEKQGTMVLTLLKKDGSTKKLELAKYDIYKN